VTIRKIIPIFLCGAALLGAGHARADTRGDVLLSIERCGVIQDDRTWLNCLYGADQPMRAQLGLPPAPEFQQRLVPALQPGMAVAPVPQRSVTRPAPVRKPGFFSTLIGAAPPTAVSRMVAYHFDKQGAFVVTLENGQEWHQVDVEGGVTANWTRTPSFYRVTVSPGAFGSYSLHTQDNPHTFKVERVQ
jgi:hypothetical protein